MRVVSDTVVFVRALINPHGLWGRLIFAHADRYTLIVSPPVVREVLEVLHRPELTRKFRSLSTVPLARVVELLGQAEVVHIGEAPPISRDPKDDKFLLTADVGAANYLVSEDQDLLVLGAYHAIPIVTAARFLTLLEA